MPIGLSGTRRAIVIPTVVYVSDSSTNDVPPSPEKRSAGRLESNPSDPIASSTVAATASGTLSAHISIAARGALIGRVSTGGRGATTEVARARNQCWHAERSSGVPDDAPPRRP